MVDPENLKKMSKDEIIECCSNIAGWGFNDYDEWEQQSAVYGLLDLYKKQQKEIEKLQKKNIGDTKFEKILFSIRMLYFHNYITYKQYLKMMNKVRYSND